MRRSQHRLYHVNPSTSSSEPAATSPDAAAMLVSARERFLSYVRARVSDPQLAEDIVQDSLLRALRAAPELRNEERLTSWFYRVLHNAIVDAYRRRGVERTRVIGLDALHANEPPAAPIAREEDVALCECFRPLVGALKPEYADLIDALDLRGEAPEAAAQRLGITPNNLKVRRHRARQALRKRLEETCRVCAEHHCLDCTCRADVAGPSSSAIAMTRLAPGEAV